MEILVSFILPFVLLLTVVVFIHEYGHYYFAKNIMLVLRIFLSDLVKKYLAGMTNQAQDGKFVGYH